LARPAFGRRPPHYRLDRTLEQAASVSAHRSGERHMLRWSLLFGSLLALLALLSDAPYRTAAEVSRPQPPVAPQRPVRQSIHSIERVDPYDWLRDANWREVLRDPASLEPEIRAHIEAENRYAEAALAPLAGLRLKLVEEMKGRIEQDESGVPTPDGAYSYWTKFVPGARNCCSTDPLSPKARPFLRLAITKTAPTTGSTPISPMRAAPKTTACAFATSAADAICRRSSPTSHRSHGRGPATHCST
jgi:Prolyl oligopeptidase, N-terminal beta-propeller domain